MQQQMSDCHIKVERTQLECVAMVMDQVGDSSTTDRDQSDSFRDSSRDSVEQPAKAHDMYLGERAGAISLDIPESALADAASMGPSENLTEISEQLSTAIADEVRARQRQDEILSSDLIK